ncbi:Protein of unknown function [Raineyella antarctica]|uniref:DUF3043 domain-containing protein n=1 Tax=Raineyella antarctica TaxID=1577474 RepID=A0A1G6GDX5_9ACTN|nr:DUF3043 domain-containing protein [Raineyella antarctica]SDB80109.1 Protein of unknown function [Raineyella antarctica]
MGLFSKKEKAAEQPVAPTPATPAGRQKKEGPTPTRREAEAARKARLNPTLTSKERRQREAEASRRSRMEQTRERDSDPGRTLMRDVVDSKFRLGEVVMPVLLIVLAASLVLGKNPALANATMIFFYLVVLAVLVDLVIMWRQFTRIHDERLPGQSRSGLFLYGMNRTLQIRRWRMPAPRVKRGEQV